MGDGAGGQEASGAEVVRMYNEECEKRGVRWWPSRRNGGKDKIIGAGHKAHGARQKAKEPFVAV